jgi:hypothetical protein
LFHSRFSVKYNQTSSIHNISAARVIYYGLPDLMYAAPALTLGKGQTDQLNACWNNVISRIYGYNRKESVKEVIYEPTSLAG